MEEEKKKIILLVEDDQSLIEMYQKKFTVEGFSISTAANGEEGLRIALSTHPDLILLDILMPKMGGMEMMQKLREDPWGKDVPIIILTNLDADDQIIQKVIEDHPAYYLMKTISDPAEIVEKVKAILGMHLH